MKKIRELYLGNSGTMIVGSTPAEYPGFSKVFSDKLFKFAKLDQISDEDVDSILKELKSDS